MRKLAATIIALAMAFTSASTSAQETTRTTIDLHWKHMPRTGDALSYQAAKAPEATLYYAVFPSRNRVIRLQWDNSGMFCKGTFSPGEEPLLECGAAKVGHYRITQMPRMMPQLEWVQTAPPPAPVTEPG